MRFCFAASLSTICGDLLRAVCTVYLICPCGFIFVSFQGVCFCAALPSRETFPRRQSLFASCLRLLPRRQDSGVVGGFFALVLCRGSIWHKERYIGCFGGAERLADSRFFLRHTGKGKETMRIIGDSACYLEKIMQVSLDWKARFTESLLFIFHFMFFRLIGGWIPIDSLRALRLLTGQGRWSCAREKSPRAKARGISGS